LHFRRARRGSAAGKISKKGEERRRGEGPEIKNASALIYGGIEYEGTGGKKIQQRRGERRVVWHLKKREK